MSKVRAEQYTNRLGTGAPEIPYGVTVPEGASIDGAGGLNLTGIATAGTFKGDLSGNVTGVAATFTGPVTIGGTLTYEDVTNIDAVGVITARDGLKITGGNLNVGTAITAYGSIGVVSATSYRGDGSQLTGIEAAPSVQLVASGSINADTGIILTSDGKVKSITNTTQAIGNATLAATAASTTLTNCAYSSTSNKVVVVYRANGTGYGVVGTVSGTTITFGTPVSFSTHVHDDSSSILDITWDPDDNVFLITWRADNNDYIYGCILTGISGTVPSFTSEFQISTTIGRYAASAYSTGQGVWLVAYSRSGANVGSCRLVSWNGSTHGIGGEVNFISGQIEKLDLCYDSNADRFVSLYKGDFDSGKLTSSVIKINSNFSISTYSQLTVMDPTTGYSPGIMYDPVTQNVVGVYKNGSQSNKMYAIVGKVNTNINKVDWQDHLPITTQAVSDNYCYRFPIIYDTLSSKFLIFYGDNATNKIHMTLAMYNSAGTGLEKVTDTALTTGGGYWFGANMDTTAHRAVLTYWDGVGSSSGGPVVKIIRPPSTDLNSENFIGFSKEAYTDGQTATVKVVGNVSTQSGLTPGKKYYVQNDGSVGQSAGLTSVPAGISLTTTSLLIQPS